MTAPTVTELPSLDFVAAVPGFPGRTSFALVALDEAGVLYALRSLDDPAVRLLVTPPAIFFPDYTPEIDDESAAALGLVDDTDAILLVVVNPGEDPTTATANLLAPIVVNTSTRRAAQVVLDDCDLPVRAPLG